MFVLQTHYFLLSHSTQANTKNEAKLKMSSCTKTFLGPGERAGRSFKVDIYEYICEHSPLRFLHFNVNLMPYSCRRVARSNAGVYYLVDESKMSPLISTELEMLALEFKS